MKNGNVKRCIQYIYACVFGLKEKREAKMKMDLFSSKCRYKDEYRDEINYLKMHNIITMFPYCFREKYLNIEIDVKWDEKKSLHYVMHKEKKLYYPAGMTVEQIQNTYRAILLEQDEESPHRYFSSEFDFEDSSIFCDVGCAEANMALEVAEKASAIFVFEAEARWIPALEATFEPYRNKVHIINMYAGREVKPGVTTIDYELEKACLPGSLYIKIDAEGAERDIISGAANALETRKVTAAVCTYHKQEDAVMFEKLFRDMGFQTEFSKGYCIYKHSEKLEPPYFRKGLIRAKNHD